MTRLCLLLPGLLFGAVSLVCAMESAPQGRLFQIPSTTNIQNAESRVLVSPIPEWVMPTEWRHAHDLCSSQAPKLILFEKHDHAPLAQHFRRCVFLLDTSSAVGDLSTLSLDFHPSWETLNLHSCKVIRKGLEIDKLSTASTRLIQREARANSNIYTGTWTLLMFLDDIREGDILEYAYSMEGSNPLWGGHTDVQYGFSFRGGARRVFCRLVADVYATRVASLENKDVFSRPLADGLHEWVWDLTDVKDSVRDADIPDWYFGTQVAQASDYCSWREVADQARCNFVESPELSFGLTNYIQTIKETHPHPDQQILALIRFVQDDIRYLSFDEFDTMRTADPSAVFSRRYGDCKDKSWLLFHMLREIGVRSYPALVSTSWKGAITSYLPSATLLDHCVLVIEHGGKTYWIDSTVSHQGGQLDQLDQACFGCGLLVGHPNVSIAECPEQNGEITQDMNVYVDLSDDPEQAEMHIVKTCTHDRADYTRWYSSSYDIDEIQQNCTQLLEHYYPGTKVLEMIKFEDDREANVMTTRESYLIRDKADKDSKRCHYIWPMSIISGTLRREDLQRTTPLALPYPFSRREEIVVKVASGCSFGMKDVSFQNEFVNYTEQHVKEGNTCRSIYTLAWLKDHIPVDRLDEIRPFVEHFDTSIGLCYSMSSDTFSRSPGMGLYAFVSFVGWLVIAYKKSKRTSSFDGIPPPKS